MSCIRLNKFPVERPVPGRKVMVFSTPKATDQLGVATAIETRDSGVAVLLDGRRLDSNYSFWWAYVGTSLVPEYEFQYRFMNIDGTPACLWVSIPESSIETIKRGAGHIQIRKLQVLSVTDYHGGD